MVDGQSEVGEARVIDRGSFALIYHAKHLKSGRSLAIKSFLPDVSRGQTPRQALDMECSLHRQLDHPFIVHYYGMLPDFVSPSALLEYVPDGSIMPLVTRQNGLAESLVLHYVIQLLSAIQYLHTQMHVTHRDLKLENILLSGDSIRLIDFGLSSIGNIMWSQCGSFPYAAPEIVRGQRYTNAVDMWSLGVCVYLMLSARFPFDSRSQPALLQAITSVAPDPLSNVSPACQDFVNKLLQKDPLKRMTIHEAIDHPFIRAHQESVLLQSGVFDSDDFRMFSCTGAPDPIVIEAVVRLGYDREKTKNISALTDDDVSLAYRILKVAKIQEALASARGSLSVARRNSSIPQRSQPFCRVKISPHGALTTVESRRQFLQKRPSSLRAPGEKVRVRRNTTAVSSHTEMTFPDDILVSVQSKSDSERN
jgi:serine/threonine protein kinase